MRDCPVRIVFGVWYLETMKMIVYKGYKCKGFKSAQ